MASTVTSGSLVYERRIVERVHKYHWPAVQLNLWMLIMLIASCLIIGVFATFIQIQQTLLLPIPWSVPPSSLLIQPTQQQQTNTASSP
jgi:arginase